MAPDDSKSSAPGPSDTDRLVKELLEKQGVHLDANVKINVVTRRIKVNADGSRTVTEDSFQSTRSPRVPPRGSKWIAAGAIVLGLAQVGYGSWAVMSDRSAATVFYAAPSCRLALLRAPIGPSPAAGAGAGCRLERATVVTLSRGSGKSSKTYYVTTVTPDGTKDKMPLAPRTAAQFWNALRPTQQARIQRFVAEGYHMTGTVVGIGADTAAVMTSANPDSGAHYSLLLIVLGLPLMAIGLGLLARQMALKPRTIGAPSLDALSRIKSAEGVTRG